MAAKFNANRTCKDASGTLVKRGDLVNEPGFGPVVVLSVDLIRCGMGIDGAKEVSTPSLYVTEPSQLSKGNHSVFASKVVRVSDEAAARIRLENNCKAGL